MPSDSGNTTSPWMAKTGLAFLPELTEDGRADVCVVGAGIAGLTTAYLIALEGRSVVVLDDGPVAGGETGRTSAHLSNVIDDRFQHVEKLLGVDGARAAHESHAQAIDRIEAIARNERIDCEFERVDGYLFLEPGQETELLEREESAARRAGFPGLSRRVRAPLPGLDTGPCLCFPHQAQFDPLRYLSGLTTAIQRMGGRIHSRSHVTKIEGGSDAHVTTKNGCMVRAQAIVVATNSPVNDRFAIHTKQAPYRTYVIAARVPRGTMPRALYWDMQQPYHYVRLAQAAQIEQELLIVGGEDHKTGQELDPAHHHDALERWMRERVPQAGLVEWRWSGQVLETLDGLAYIGPNPGDEDNVYVATGDSGMGLTHGTLAGIILSDFIAGRESQWAHLYDPSRKTLRAAGPFLKENLNVAAQYVRDYASPGEISDPEDLEPGTGAIVRHGLTKVAAYRDPAGHVHEFSAVCPHLGCIVHWNDVEKTFDCPCHGSRFSNEGRVINGPANRDLAAVDEQVAK